MRAPPVRNRKPAPTVSLAAAPAVASRPQAPRLQAPDLRAVELRSTKAAAIKTAAPEPATNLAVPAPPDRAVAVAGIRVTAASPAACFYSSAIDGDMSGILGMPHYSYRFAEAKFLQAFAAAGMPLAKLAMPEFYSTEWSLPNATAAGLSSIVHLIFRSTEQIRLLKIGVNIACFAWEFEVLKDDTRPNEHPFLNQKRMLSICDEVWVPCAYTAAVLAAHGIAHVHVIPAPIAVPSAPRVDHLEALSLVGHVNVMPLIYNFVLPREQNAAACAAAGLSMIDWLAPRLGAARDPLIYLAVLNPEDFRKNIDTLIRGFFHFQQAHKGVYLIVKVLTSTDRFSLERVLSDVIPNKLASGSVFATDNIMFMNRFLSDDEMSALYAMADFYVCTSAAEGQNLPLLEAMAHGTVPVSTRNTAMADYISPANAFVIEEKLVLNSNQHLAGTIAAKPFHIHTSTSRDVFAALVQSRKATSARRRQLSAACVQTVRATFGVDVVWARIQARLDAIRAARAADLAGRMAEGA